MAQQTPPTAATTRKTNPGVIGSFDWEIDGKAVTFTGLSNNDWADIQRKLTGECVADLAATATEFPELRAGLIREIAEVRREGLSVMELIRTLPGIQVALLHSVRKAHPGIAVEDVGIGLADMELVLGELMRVSGAPEDEKEKDKEPEDGEGDGGEEQEGQESPPAPAPQTENQ